MFAASLFALAALAQSAFAAISITAPIASTSWPAGQQQTLNWRDDGNAPALKDFGPSSVGIFAGNQIQQTQLQLIVDNVDVSTTGSISFTPDASIGPNGLYYFIRFTSLGLKDPSNALFPAEAFSAKFELTGMSGTFNATVQAQVNAASSAPANGATSAPAGGSSSAPSSPATTNNPSSTVSGSASHSASSTSKSGSPSATGAAQNSASGVFASVGLVGTVVALAAGMLL